jgi:hypothetical protein
MGCWFAHDVMFDFDKGFHFGDHRLFCYIIQDGGEFLLFFIPIQGMIFIPIGMIANQEYE